MTIFHVLPQFHFVNERTIIGGYPSAVARLAVAQAAQGSRVEIVSRMPELSISEFADVGLSNLEVLDASSHRHPVRFARKLLKFLRPRVKSGDWIHVHSGHAEYAFVSGLIGLTLGVGVLHTLYCPLRGRTRGRAQRFAVKMARACGVTFSGMSRNICKSIPGPSAWTPPVIDSQFFDPKYNSPNNNQILFVGNATPSKGLADLLPAFVEFVEDAEHGERMRLVVTTELARTRTGSEIQEVVEGLKDAVAMSQIAWLSIVSDMRDLLGGSAIHVAPFRTTNGPSDYFISTLEAMSMGKVCIVSDLPGMAEVVREGETGFCFRSGDPVDLRRALDRAVECDRIALGRRARSFVIETFGESAIETTNSLYGELNA